MVLKISIFSTRPYRRYEHIEDPLTREVLHHDDHSLGDHKGHGSDRSTGSEHRADPGE
jgi:hypothetical protein